MNQLASLTDLHYPHRRLVAQQADHLRGRDVHRATELDCGAGGVLRLGGQSGGTDRLRADVDTVGTRDARGRDTTIGSLGDFFFLWRWGPRRAFQGSLERRAEAQGREEGRMVRDEATLRQQRRHRRGPERA